MKIILALVITCMFCGLMMMAAPRVKPRPTPLAQSPQATDTVQATAPQPSQTKPWVLTMGTGAEEIAIAVSMAPEKEEAGNNVTLTKQP